MPNMLDYIAWRGDLTLAQAGLNECDELILSQLAYVAFGEHLPGLDRQAAPVRLGEAAGWLLAHDPEAKRIHQTGFMWKENKRLLAALRDSVRFADMGLWGYVDELSPEDEKQFAAMTVDVGDGSTLVTFRGTDDSLVGWKEDLNMAFDSPIPAQLAAVDYLQRVAEMVPGPLRLMGHSKGGNLAVYAAAASAPSVQARLLDVVSHDGPGQAEETLASAGYAAIRDRLRVYLPHFSFVGMLLAHESSYTVVQSDGKTILQHDAFTWQMEGTRMCQTEGPSEDSLYTNRVIRQWMQTLSEPEQRLFVEAVYEIASKAYGDTIPEDVEVNWSANAQGVFAGVLRLEPKTRAMFTKGIGELFSTAIKNIRLPRLPWHRDEEKAVGFEGLLGTGDEEEG